MYIMFMQPHSDQPKDDDSGGLHVHAARYERALSDMGGMNIVF
jgi:hypothetical protein